MPTVQSKLSAQLDEYIGPQWKKWTLITAGVTGTLLIGRYVAQKYYVESISKVLKTENERHEQARLEKSEKSIDSTNEDASIEAKTVTSSALVSSSKSSLSEPTTPINQPSGLAMLSEINRTGNRGTSLCDLNSNIARLPSRRRAVPSLASTQINMSLQTPEELIMFGNEYVKRALKIWDDTRNRITDDVDEEHVKQLQTIIQSTKQLIIQIDTYTKQMKRIKEKMRESRSSAGEETLNKLQTDEEGGFDSEIPDDATEYGSPTSSLESYSTLTYYDIEPNIHFFKLYTKALETNDILEPRVDRFEMVGCSDSKEFVAKVHCLRQAFELMFKSKKNCDVFTKIGEEILRVLLENSSKDIDECLTIYHRFIDHVCDKKNHELLTEEIKFRNIPCLSFYDLVIDYIILDSFEELENPQQAIVSVVNNGWFSTSFKIGALQRAVGAVIKYKRSRLKIENGFFSNFYDILQIISPILAWGFLGSDNDLKLKCNLIKQAIQELIRDYFDFNRVRFTNVADLAEDILIVTDIRFDDLQSKLRIFE